MIRELWQLKYIFRVRLIKSLVSILFITVGMSSCVMIPYEPSADVSLSDDGHMPLGDLMVTVGPRELLEKVSEEIEKADSKIEITDPIAFRDAAFPSGNWRITRLLEKGNCRRVSRELGVEYLVLVGEVKEIEGDEVGGIGVWIGFYGAGYAEEEVRLSATIIDMANERHLFDIDSSARGTSSGVGLFYGLFIVPMTESGAIEGLGQEIAKRIRNSSSKENIKIAVLAMENLDGVNGLDANDEQNKESLEKSIKHDKPEKTGKPGYYIGGQ